MKKIIAIFILTFLLVGVLTGCSEDLPDEKDIPKTEDGTTEEGGKGEKEEETSGTPATEDKKETEDNKETAPDHNEGSSETENDSNAEPVLTVGTQIGNLMKSVTLEKVGGGTVSIEEFRGKIIVFNIWATWCPPCKAELPDFNKAAGEYADDVVIIAAHTPRGSANAESYVATNFPNTDIIFAYDTPYSEAYLAAGGDGYVPYTVILDQQGVIIYSGSGVLSHSQLVSFIEKLKVE